MVDELTFPACFPANAETPVKPSKDFDGSRRRVRLWLDIYAAPGDTERLMLLGQDAELEVTIKRKA